MSSYHAKKRLGQNFLMSQEVIEQVIDLIEADPADRIVEIGAGRGALTLPLAETGANIWAVEFDRDLIDYLTSLLADHNNVTILNQDFLAFDPDDFELDQFKLIGNLPYNITSPVIDWCVRHRTMMVTAVLMVQKEVGARLAASPGCKDWSPLSIFTQMVFTVDHCFDVAAEHFHPEPQVNSSVLRLTPIEESIIKFTPELEIVVRASFRQRRKTLVNNLSSKLVPTNKDGVEILENLEINPKARAESLSIDQFLNLTAALVERKLV